MFLQILKLGFVERAYASFNFDATRIEPRCRSDIIEPISRNRVMRAPI